MPVWLRTQGWAGRGLGFLFGGLGVLGHAPLHLWPLGLVSFALLFIRLLHTAQTRPGFKAGFGTAFWHGLGYFGLGIFWIGSAFIARGPAFIPIMPPMVLGLAALLALFWAVAGGIFARSQLKGLHAAIFFTAAMSLAELARGHLFGGFPWNLPGYIFEAGSRPSQIASLINIYGLSWIVLFISAALGLLMHRRHRIAGGIIAVLGLAGLYGYGHMRLSSAQITMAENVNIRLVNVPFSQAEKFDPEKSRDIVNKFLTVSVAPGLEDVTHLIWPEGAVNGLAMESEALLYAMGRELSAIDSTPPVWIMNSLRLQTRPHPRSGDIISDYFNSSVAITYGATGTPTIAAYNDKHRLVPFGEFIPGGKWLESYDFPLVSTALASMTPAPEKRLADFPGLPRLSPQICYEADFPGLTPIDKARPVQLILNQTNDAWYGKTWGPAQHANIARYRALEEGLPMVRSASNGLSAIIDPYGRIYKSIPRDDLSHIDTGLPNSLRKTRQTRLIIFFNCLINLLIFGMYIINRRELGLRQI